MDYIIEIFRSPVGSVTQVVSLIFVFVFLIWKVSHFHTKYSDIEKLDLKFTSIEEKVEKKIDRIDAKIDDLKQSLMTIKSFIDNFQNSNNPFAKRKSPISLTPSGVEVSKEIDAEKMVDKHWHYIIKKVNESLDENCNPYDIQVLAFSIGDLYLSFLTKEEIDVVKNNAFNKGYDLSVYDLLFGIIIRDRLLREKNIKIEDVERIEFGNFKSVLELFEICEALEIKLYLIHLEDTHKFDKL